MAEMRHEVPMSDLMKNITVEVTVTGMKSFRVRFAIGTFLMKLSAKIMGVGLKIDLKGDW